MGEKDFLRGDRLMASTQYRFSEDREQNIPYDNESITIDFHNSQDLRQSKLESRRLKLLA
ncbi:hypothetical protein NIES208_05610 [[Limnothrix rosea] IAM M-220]|nr:hypothetical protein NIES208_05610 [[Limnothrix rosea] IAM M-220]